MAASWPFYLTFFVATAIACLLATINLNSSRGPAKHFNNQFFQGLAEGDLLVND
jgi:hypothetical protein